MSKIKVYPVKVVYNISAPNKVQAAAIMARLVSDEVALAGDWYVEDQKEIELPEQKTEKKEDD